MNNTPDVPKLPVWPFVLSDAVLLYVAYEVGSSSPGPLSGLPLATVASCVTLGAVLLGLPFVVNYARNQELQLTAREREIADRQRELSALAASTATSSEQLGIIISNLAGLSEGLSKSTRHLEQLPQRLQERVNEMKEHLNEVAVTENEALAQEVNTLRASEVERLESAVAQSSKVSKEMERLHGDLLAAFAKARADLQSVQSAALNDQVQAALKSLDEKLAAFKALDLAVTPAVPAPIPAPEVRPAHEEPVAHAPVPAPVAEPSEPVSQASPLPAVESVHVTDPGVSIPPIPALHSTPPPLDEIPVAEVAAAEVPVAEVVPAPQTRKPAKRRELDGFELSLDLGESVSSEQEIPVRALSADGLTRVLVTAYIGIGNKLFVRGEGPGLSWEKGVPLHFVSIGKWRWETPDAVSTIKLRLYRNDAQPAANHAEIAVDPGQQLELTATF